MFLRTVREPSEFSRALTTEPFSYMAFSQFCWTKNKKMSKDGKIKKSFIRNFPNCHSNVVNYNIFLRWDSPPNQGQSCLNSLALNLLHLESKSELSSTIISIMFWQICIIHIMTCKSLRKRRLYFRSIYVRVLWHCPVWYF